MSRRNIKRLVCAVTMLFLVGTFVTWSVRADDENEFEFTGVISSLPNTTGFIGDWIVGGRTVHVAIRWLFRRCSASPQEKGETAFLQEDSSVI